MKKQKKEAASKKPTKKKKKQIKKQTKKVTKKTTKKSSKTTKSAVSSSKVKPTKPVSLDEVVVNIPPPVRKRKLNYLNNRDLLIQVALSKAQGKMTNELALMLHTLCARYARRGNFVNYTYNDDMQAYALLSLVKTWHSFNTAKSNNPFAFFTQCIKHSFIQYLNQEKRQRDVRDSIMVRHGMTPSFSYTAEHASDGYHDSEEPYDNKPTDGDDSGDTQMEEDNVDYELEHNEVEVNLDTHDEGMTEDSPHEEQ